MSVKRVKRALVRRSAYAVFPIQGAPDPYRFAVVYRSGGIMPAADHPGDPEIPLMAAVGFYPDTMSAYLAAVEADRTRNKP